MAAFVYPGRLNDHTEASFGSGVAVKVKVLEGSRLGKVTVIVIGRLLDPTPAMYLWGAV
jgi:hypothetical protein